MFSELKKLQDGDKEAVQLPRWGDDLSKVVQVVLTSVNEEEERLHLITTSTVRRAVVVNLIEAMVERGHPEYREFNMEDIRKRAACIPVGPTVPENVRAVMSGNLNIDEERDGKGAVPPQCLAQVGEDPFAGVQCKGRLLCVHK